MPRRTPDDDDGDAGLVQPNCHTLRPPSVAVLTLAAGVNKQHRMYVIIMDVVSYM